MGAQPSTVSQRAQPLAEVGEHQLWHMSCFDNEEVGRMYASTARRGNPVLANATDEALLIRGQEMAQAARSNPCSYVCTDFHGTPAACFFSWDATEEPVFSQDPSMSVHRKLHGLVFQERAKRMQSAKKGDVIHCAYGGCLPGEPAMLLLLMQITCVRAAWWAGYKQMYGCAVNPVTVRGTAATHQAYKWAVPFDAVVLEDGSCPLAGQAPHRAVASLQPIWPLACTSYLVPQSAIPWISEQRKKQDAARRRRRAQQAPETPDVSGRPDSSLAEDSTPDAETTHSMPRAASSALVMRPKL